MFGRGGHFFFFFSFQSIVEGLARITGKKQAEIKGREDNAIGLFVYVMVLLRGVECERRIIMTRDQLLHRDAPSEAVPSLHAFC